MQAAAWPGKDIPRLQGLGFAIDRLLDQQLTLHEQSQIRHVKDVAHKMFAPNQVGVC